MGFQEWKHFHDAQTLLNAEDHIREHLQAGTYAGHTQIEDEWQLDQMVKQAKREVEAGRLFHFDNMSNNYDLEQYSVEPENYGTGASEEPEEPRGFFSRLFGR